MRPAKRREQHVLPDARYRLREAIAHSRSELCFVGGFGSFSLDVGGIERNERANVQLRARQAVNLVSEIEARGAHRRWRRAHQRSQFRNQPSGRCILWAHIRDERRRAIDATRSRQRSNVSYERVLAKTGFYAFEVNADATYLDLSVLASYSLQQAVSPLAYEVSRSKGPTCAHATGFNALVRATSIGPTSQRHVWACDHELPDFARLRAAAILVDYREAVARERIADWNAGIFASARVVDEPLQHRCFCGSVDQLDIGPRREPGAQQVDVAPQRGVAAYTNQPKCGPGVFCTGGDDRSQESREREQDRNGLCADHFRNLARAGVLRVEKVNTCPCQQCRHDVAHPDDRARRGESQKSVLCVDVRGVDGLSHALQEVSLTVDDALWTTGTPGGE